MSRYVLVHVCEENCAEQAGLFLTIDMKRVPERDFPLVQGKQITFENPKLGEPSKGWVILIYDDMQEQVIRNSIVASRHHSCV